MKKREEFAVNLRKKKTEDIIKAKRRRLIGTYDDDPSGPEHIHDSYKGYAPFDKNEEFYQQKLHELVPQLKNH